MSSIGPLFGAELVVSTNGERALDVLDQTRLFVTANTDPAEGFEIGAVDYAGKSVQRPRAAGTRGRSPDHRSAAPEPRRQRVARCPFIHP